MTQRVLLIYPPHTRNTEPPLGLAILSRVIRDAGIPVRLLDLNIEAGTGLAKTVPDRGDTRSHRTALHIQDALHRLRGSEIYGSYSRYQTAINHYGEACRILSDGQPWTLTPGNFEDSRFMDYSRETVNRMVKEFRNTPFIPGMIKVVRDVLNPEIPGVVGLSVIYRTQFIPAVMLGAWLQSEYPEIRVILGGSFLKMLPSDTCEFLDTQFDFVSTGDGVSDIRRYLGIPDRSGDLFPDPDFTDSDFSRYFAPHPVIPLTSSRGCYWARCTFCDECHLPYAQQTPKAFTSQLARLWEQYKPGIFHFTDNAIPPDILQTLAESGSPAPWYGFTRMLPMLAKPGFPQKLRDSGCVMLQLGLESPVPAVLKKMRKGVDPADFGTILDNLKSAGIRSYVYIMFGYPGQTPADNTAAQTFFQEHPPDFLNASIFRLPRNSAMVTHPREFGISPDFSSADARLNQPFQQDGLQMDDLRKWLSGSFYRNPVIRTVRTRTPRYYKSNHAPYF